MIKHITVNVTDIDASVDFYSKYIGLKVINDLRSKGPQIVFMAHNESDETMLEIILNNDNPYHGSGVSLGFGVDNVTETHEYFQSEGLKVTPVTKPNPFTEFFFVFDPAGLKVQIINK